ncbi:MAG: hypothetical protein ACLFTK_15560 [Anaerolineales bacterium]
MNNIFGTIMSLGVVGLGLVACSMAACIIACAGVILLAGAAQEANQEELIALNDGFGASSNPIPTGRAVEFNDVRVQIVNIVRPANNLVLGAPASGSDYVLVEFALTCKAQACDGSNLGARLIDNQGEEWRQAIAIMTDGRTAIHDADAVSGSTARGFMPFEFPQGRSIERLRVSYNLSPDVFVLYNP